MSKIYSQKTFDEDHTEPVDYGEGNYYIVGDNFTNAEAAKMIGEWESYLTGEYYEYVAEDIGGMQMYAGKNEDGEDDWVVNNWSSEKPLALGKGISL